MTKSICGLLALAALSSVAMAQDAPKAASGWSAKPGSGLKYDGGDAFSFNMANQLQVHWVFTSIEKAPTASAAVDTANFTIRRARTTFTGHVFDKHLHYKLQVDAADAAASIKEGNIDWDFQDSEDCKAALRFGQAKVGFGLEGTGSSSGLFFVERSSAARGFSDSYSRGAWLVGSAMKNALRWSAGVMNGDAAGALGAGVTDHGEEANNTDNKMSYTGMVNFDPLGDFNGGKGTESFRQGDFRTDDKSLKGTVGLGVALGNSHVGSNVGDSLTSTSFNFNTAWSLEGAQVLAEYFMRKDDRKGASDTEDSSGWAVSGTYLLPKNGDNATQWGVGIRVGQVSTDNGDNASVDFLTGLQGIGSQDGDCTEISAVVDAFYHSHSAKSQIEYTYQDVAASGAGVDSKNHIVRLAFQLLF